MTWQREIERRIKGKGPILIGPWLSELGFEVLYWLPFLAWVRDQYKLPAERLRVCSRGGAGWLYGVKRGIELYKLRAVKDLRIQAALRANATGSIKQQRLTPWDAAIVRDCERETGEHYRILDPSLMYRAFGPVWGGKLGLNYVLQHTRWAGLPVPPLPEGLTLPERFTVVRFYGRHTFPLTGMLQHWARGYVERLAEREPVVILEPPDVTDDHLNFVLPADAPGRIQRVRDQLTLETNVATQAAVIARASRFVGTYGGLAQMALRYGRPTLCYWAGAGWSGTRPEHLELTQRIAREMGVPFHCLHFDGDLKFLAGVL